MPYLLFLFVLSMYGHTARVKDDWAYTVIYMIM